MNCVNYKTLYLDFLKDDSIKIPTEQRNQLLNMISREPSEEITYRKMIQLNGMIKKIISPESNNQRTQRLKSYSEDYIKHILAYQKENNLSNLSVALEFNISRNTISKWKKRFL
ncbi:MAG: hypothetical protein N4A45_13805 [Flavobacteriales bacterium]|jgi:DNA-binding transcriptional regulator YiaG|nr:hypothetical protein [Flavobacteriales bacterium]